jgi:hypothetical protein
MCRVSNLYWEGIQLSYLNKCTPLLNLKFENMLVDFMKVMKIRQAARVHWKNLVSSEARRGGQRPFPLRHLFLPGPS